MKKANLFLLSAISFTMFSCGPSEPALEKVTLKLNNDKTGLVWDNVENAESYELVVNDEEPVAATSYTFSNEVNSYSVKVRAVKGKKYGEYSDPFTYETKVSNLDALSNDGLVVTWGDQTACNGLEASFNEGTYVAVNDNYVAPDNGIVTIRTKTGFNEASSTYYVDTTTNVSERRIFVSKKGQDSLLIEDASAPSNADLQEGYQNYKYDNGWVTSQASVALNGSNDGITDGKCIEYSYWRQNIYFKFTKDVTIDGSYNMLSLFLKGDGVSTISLSFEINKPLMIGNQNLAGTYISYAIPVVEKTWKQYNISLDDPDWKVDVYGTKLSFADACRTIEGLGAKASKITDLLHYFDSFSVRAKAVNDENWSKTTAYADDIKLLNVENPQTNTKTFLRVRDAYAFESTSGAYGFVKKTESGAYAIINDEEKTYRINNGLTMTSNEEGKLVIDGGENVKIVASSNDDGQTFVADEVTGDLASSLQGVTLSAMSFVDDFESYTEKGVGYDKNHESKEGRSGIRAAYYSDYYPGGSVSSPVGGTGWSLMGSTDYLNLFTGATPRSNSYGSQSASVKFGSNAMRMMTWGLVDGADKPVGQGSTFSFWAKGQANDAKFKLRVYYVDKVDKTNHTSSSASVDAFTNDPVLIPANSPWTEYKLAINPDKPVYGFALFPQAGSGTQYIPVDDITIYSGISPWGK